MNSRPTRRAWAAAAAALCALLAWPLARGDDAGVPDAADDVPFDVPAPEDAGVGDADGGRTEPSCGDLMIVFDRSGSMYQCAIGGKTKEEIAIGALQAVIRDFPNVPMGLMVFPDTVKLCGVTTHCRAGEVQVGIAEGSAAAVSSYLGAMTNSCGGTPTGDALVGVRNYTGWLPGKRHHVLLMTDGSPTCQDDVEGKCNGMGRAECTNPTKAYESIDDMRQENIHTFVVGFEGDATYTGSTTACPKPFNTDTLNKFADLGGEAQTGSTRYLSATSEATLLDALKRVSDKVAGSTAGCGPPNQDAGGSGGAGGGAPPQDTGASDAAPVPHEPSGCGCRAGGEASARSAPGCLLMIWALARVRRRRSAWR